MRAGEDNLFGRVVRPQATTHLTSKELSHGFCFVMSALISTSDIIRQGFLAQPIQHDFWVTDGDLT
jgi:hypothetical protein